MQQFGGAQPAFALGGAAAPQVPLAAAPLAAAAPQPQPYAASPAVSAHRGDRESLLRHVGADSFYISSGPMSADELRWHTLCHLHSMAPGSTDLPPWITHAVVPVVAASSADPAAATPSTSAPASVAGAGGTPSVSSNGSGEEVVRHPDPSTSLEELRWRDYTAIKAGQQPAQLAPAPQPQAQAQPLGAVAGGAAAAGSSSSSAVPFSPLFPTPVRTLFPPTPPPAMGAAASGAAGGGGGAEALLLLGAGGGAEVPMDTLEEPPDLPACFKCMYASPEASVASPEEMQLVQRESYKTGTQVRPYWLLGGA